MYNVVINVPKQEQDGSMVDHADYKAIVIAAIGLPAISHAFSYGATSNKIALQREISEAADVIAAMSSYTDVTVTVTEIVPIIE